MCYMRVRVYVCVCLEGVCFIPDEQGKAKDLELLVSGSDFHNSLSLKHT